MSASNKKPLCDLTNFVQLTEEQLAKRQQVIEHLNITHRNFNYQLLEDEREVGINDTFQCQTFEAVNPYLLNFYEALWEFVEVLADYYCERRKRVALQREILKQKSENEKLKNKN